MFKFLYISWCISCIHVYNINDRNHIICACVCVSTTAVRYLYYMLGLTSQGSTCSISPMGRYPSTIVDGLLIPVSPWPHSVTVMHFINMTFLGEWTTSETPRLSPKITKDLQIYSPTQKKCKKESRGPWPMLNHSQVDSPPFLAKIRWDKWDERRWIYW